MLFFGVGFVLFVVFVLIFVRHTTLLCSSVTMEDYDIHEQIGGGAYGDVLKAVHKPTQQIVAIKLIHLPFVECTKLPRNIIREIQALRHTQHKNVVGLLDVIPKYPGKDILLRSSVNAVGGVVRNLFVYGIVCAY